MSRRHGLVATLLGFAGLVAQEPPAPPKPPAQQPPPAPAAPSAADVHRAQALLQRHAERSRGAKTLVADYVQRRTTELLKEPLVSKGRFLFVRDPAVVVFFASEPRPSVVRLAESVYEVHRPQRKQLERFHLDGPELARGLFAAVGGDVDRLLRDFTLAGVADGPAESGVVCLQLAPKTDAVRARVRGLDLTLQAADGMLREVAYRDPAGDRVAIELLAPVLDPVDPPSPELKVDKDTVVVEHRPKPPGK